MNTPNNIIKLIYLLFILNIPQNIYSQVDVLLHQPERIASIYYDQFSEELPSFRNKTYEYNANGTVSLVSYYNNELNGKVRKEDAFEYHNGKKTTEKITFFCDLPNCANTTRTTTFRYQDTCLVQEQLVHNSPDGMIKETKTYDSTHCQILSEFYETKFGKEQVFTPFYKTEWTYTDTSIERRYYKHLRTNEFKLYEREQQLLDATGKVRSKVIEDLNRNKRDSIAFIYEPDSSFIIQEKHFVSFEQQAFQLTKIITRKNLRETARGFFSLKEFNAMGILTHLDSTDWQLFYDDAANLEKIESSRTQFYEGWEEAAFYHYTHLFEYDCQDRLTQTIREDNLGGVWVQRLYYEKEISCPLIEDSNPIEEAISIYPNPAKDFVRVENELFKSQATTVRIVDMSGIVHFQELRNIGLSHSFINISSFSTGLYFVEAILNDQTLARGKFVKY